MWLKKGRHIKGKIHDLVKYLRIFAGGLSNGVKSNWIPNPSLRYGCMEMGGWVQEYICSH
jgi:hypothetical protein